MSPNRYVPDSMKYILYTTGCFLGVTCAVGSLLVHKVCTRLMWSLSIIGCLYFEGYMARLIVKNKHQKDLCFDKIGLCAHNTDALPGPSIIYTIERTYNVIIQRVY